MRRCPGTELKQRRSLARKETGRVRSLRVAGAAGAATAGTRDHPGRAGLGLIPATAIRTTVTPAIPDGVTGTDLMHQSKPSKTTARADRNAGAKPLQKTGRTSRTEAGGKANGTSSPSRNRGPQTRSRTGKEAKSPSGCRLLKAAAKRQVRLRRKRSRQWSSLTRFTSACQNRQFLQASSDVAVQPSLETQKPRDEVDKDSCQEIVDARCQKSRQNKEREGEPR